jgi:hypothetical protein
MPTKKTTGGGADASRMTDAARQRVQAELASGKDETRANLLFSLTTTTLLLAIVDGLIDPVLLARRQLANRGLDENGEWVGTERAAQIHGVQR